MELLESFKQYLLSQKEKSSRATIKNYLADIRKFINWFEKTISKEFKPNHVTNDTIQQFKNSFGKEVSIKSIERYLSTLRKFFQFLKLEGVISSSPFQVPVNFSEKESDPWQLKPFKNFLYVYNASPLTIKNYVIDVKQFILWIKETSDRPQEELLERIKPEIVTEYKNHLLSEKIFSPTSINRKLSSLKKYFNWASSQGYIQTTKFEVKNDEKLINEDAEIHKVILETVTNGEIKLPAIVEESKDQKKTSYSKFPPLRLVQKLYKLFTLAIDFVIVNPFITSYKQWKIAIWKLTGKKVFIQEDKLNENQNKDKLLELTNLPWYKKFFYHIQNTRPKWYRRYHQYAIAHYFNLSILVILSAIIGVGLYSSFVQNPQKNKIAASTLPVAPPRILSFQGRLTNLTDTPITSASNLRFAIYDDSAATGSGHLLWQEVDNVTPDADGIFSILLGNTATNCGTPTNIATGPCQIPSTLFSQNATLYLGITVESTSELTPRQQLATVAYATNSETLQGLPPITQSGSGTTNVVLALDGSGNLTIGGTATPTFTASGGQFTLSGKTLMLKTESGSNTNVVIAPDGSGIIDLQKPLHNSTNNNNIASALGAVEIDGLAAILATSSGQSALTINQNSTGPIISASSSGAAKFTVDYLGNTTVAGNISVGGVSSDLIPSLNDTYNLGSDPNAAGREWNSLYVKNLFVNGGSVTQYWRLTSNVLSPLSSAYDLAVGGTGSSSATPFQVFALSNGTIPAGTASTSGQLSFTASANQINLLNNSSLGIFNSVKGDIGINATTPALYITNGGNVGLGTNNPLQKLQIASGNLSIDNSEHIYFNGGADNTWLLGKETSPTGAQLVTSTALVFQVQNNTPNQGFMIRGASPQTSLFEIQGSNGQAYFSGNVGIGTITPLTALQISGSASESGNLTYYGAGVNHTVDILQNGTLGFYPSVGGDAGTGNPAIYIANSSSIGLGTNSPLATLDVRYNSGINPIASISGKTAFAGLVVDNSGLGDILTASASGATRLIINQAGNVTIGPKVVADDTNGAGGASGVGSLVVSNTGSGVYPKLILNGPANGGSGIEFYSAGATQADISYINGSSELDISNRKTGPITFQYWTGSQMQEILRTTSNGEVLIGATSTNVANTGLDIEKNALGNSVFVANQKGLGDILTASASGNTKFVITNNGSIGDGTVNPLATIDIRGNSGITPVASISGKTSFAALVVDNSGVGDLFAASSAGARIFTIASNGTITNSGYTAGILHSNGSGLITSSAVNLAGSSSEVSGILPLSHGGTNADLSTIASTNQGGIVYSTGTTLSVSVSGSSGQCLVSGITGAPTWGSCGGGGTSAGWWTVAANPGGAITQVNETMDVLVGGNATSSAKFAILNLGDPSATNNPTASLSAITGNNAGHGISFDSTGTIQSFLSNPLTIGGTTTGNVIIKPLNGAGTVQFNSSKYSTGLIHSDNTGLLSSSAVALGSGDVTGTLGVGNGGTGLASLTAGDMLYYTSGNSFSRLGIGTNNYIMTSNGSNPQWSQNITVPGTLTVTGNASFNGSIATSLIPTGTINLGSAGNPWNVVYANSFITPIGNGTAGYWSVSGNTLYPISTFYDLLVGGTATSSATPWQVFSNTVGVATAGTATTSGGLTFRNTADVRLLNGSSLGFKTSVGGDSSLSNSLYLSANGNTGIGTTTPNTFKLQIAGSAGPDTGDTYNLGAAGTRWNNVYAVAFKQGVSNLSVLDTSNVSGTPNYIAKFTATNTVGIGLLYDNGSSIGIGTTSPGNTLSVENSSNNNAIENFGGFSCPSCNDYGIIDVTSVGGAIAAGQERPLQLQPSGQVNGTVGIGLSGSNPLAELDVRDNSGTTPIASFSGKTAFAGMVVNNSGLGDIFTASASGATRFVIGQSGNTTIGENFLPQATDTYNLGSNPATGGFEWQNIYVHNIISPSGGGVSGYWQLNGTQLAPTSPFYDLLVGGTASGSATPWQVFANAFNTQPAGTATSSGNLSFRGTNSNINLLNGDNLNIYTSTGGDAGLTNRLTISNNGNVGIATTSATTSLQVAGDVLIGKDAINWGVANYAQRIQVKLNNTFNANGTNATTLTNYQQRIVLNTYALTSINKMRSDCGDIRFTDEDGATNLNYWQEGPCGNSTTSPTTIFWVNVPTIPGGQVKTIYAYYNNSAATSASTTSTFVRTITNVQGAWNLDEASSTSPATDLSGNNNTASASAGTTVIPVNGTNTVFNNARSFNGTSDYINVADSASLQQATPLSLSAWVKFTSTTSDSVIVRKDTLTGTRYLYSITANPSAVGAGVSQCPTSGTGKVIGQYYNGTNFYACSNNAINDGNWHYVVMTISGTTDTLYVDGVAQTKTATITGTQGVPTGSLTMGAAPTYNGGPGITSYYNGSLDEVRVYNAALSSAQISDLYGAGGNRVGYVSSYVANTEYVAAFTNNPPLVNFGQEQNTTQVLPNFYIQNSTGNIGIGTSSLATSSAKLSIAGDIKSGSYDNVAWASGLSTYQYRSKIAVDNTASSSALTNYQVKITLNTQELVLNGKMRSDCGDIRFTDNDGATNLNYWIETTTGNTSSCDQAITTIWVKVPSIPGNSIKNIYMYYGNPTASAVSSGTSTFDFYDHFANLTNWTATGAESISNGQLSITTGSVYSNATVMNQPGEIIESKVKWTTASSGYSGLSTSENQNPGDGNNGKHKEVLYMMTNGGTTVNLWANDGNTASTYNVVSGAVLFTPTLSTQYIIGQAITPSQLVIYQNRAITNTYTDTFTSAQYAMLGHFQGSGAGTTAISNITIDWVIARKYSANPPITTVTSEQDKSQVNSVLYVDSTSGRIGINDANPLTTLSLVTSTNDGSQDGINVWSNDRNGETFIDYISNPASSTGATTPYAQFGGWNQQLSTWANTIIPGGNVGIGTYTPGASLAVNGTIQGSRFVDYDNTAYFLDPAASGTSMAVLGSVGIGTTSPGSPLDINSSTDNTLAIETNLAGSFTHAGQFLNGSMTTGQNYVINIGRATGTDNAAYFGFNNAGGAGSSSNFATIGLWGADNILNVRGDSSVWVNATGANYGSAFSTNFFVRNPNTLGGTAGNYLSLGSFEGSTNGNNSGVGIRLYRHTTGSAWTTASAMIALEVDNSINPSGKFITLSNVGTGINTLKPGAQFDVTSSSCSNFQASGTCTDYAEFYNASETVAPAEIVTLDNASASGKLVKLTRKPYDSSVIGIASTTPAFSIDESHMMLGSWAEALAPSLKPQIALAGRVPVKVSTINGPIHIGDSITSSMLAGFGMKATQAGSIVGKAMQEFDPTSNNVGGTIIDCPSGTAVGVVCGNIYAFVNTSLYDPSVYLTSTGDVTIADQVPNTDFTVPHYYTLNDALGNPIDRVGTFSEVAIAHIRAGLIETQQITTNSLVVSSENIAIGGKSIQNYIIGVVQQAINNGTLQNTGVISPLAQIDQVHTNVISPLAQNSSISLKFDQNKISVFNDSQASSSAVASIDNQGNATFSGSLKSENLAVNSDATISGTLRAHNIVADNIDALAAKVSTLAAQNITNVTNIFFATPSANTTTTASASGTLAASNNPFQVPNSFTDVASYSAFLAYVPHLEATAGVFQQGLTSYGQTNLSDTNIVGQLAVDGQMILTGNTINSLGADIEIQPLRQGGVSFLAGAIKIDQSGNLTVNGNSIFNGNLAVKTISPLPGEDLTLKLSDTLASTSASQLTVQNASGSGVFAINQLGDFIASGTGTFNKINLNFAQQALAVSDTEVVATGSAGTAIINIHQKEVTIDNPLVTDKSLIYITPVGDTGGQTPFLLRQVSGTSFTVGTSQLTTQSVNFNWLIVN